MSSHSLPSTAAEEIKAKKRIGEAVKPRNRGSKRTSSTASARHHSTTTSIPRTDSRRKRVWKACERCRTKKTKVYYVARIYFIDSANLFFSVTVCSLAKDVKMTA